VDAIGSAHNETKVTVSTLFWTDVGKSQKSSD